MNASISITGEKKQLVRLTRNQRAMEKSARIMQFLLKYGPMTRKDLVKATGLSRTTVFDALSRLECNGKVRRFSYKAHSGRGRPNVLWKVFNR
ncbi:MAG: helix-turn-helix domain-containing protein [Candidatus Hodarchaeales archaeon]|jgi:predicted ArsR family transcriptional regulator